MWSVSEGVFLASDVCSGFKFVIIFLCINLTSVVDYSEGNVSNWIVNKYT